MQYLDFEKRCKERFGDEPGTEWRGRERHVGQAAAAGTMEAVEPVEQDDRIGGLAAISRVPREVIRASLEMYPDAA